MNNAKIIIALEIGHIVGSAQYSTADSRFMLSEMEKWVDQFYQLMKQNENNPDWDYMLEIEEFSMEKIAQNPEFVQ